jgi:hypothetical protein
MKLKFKLITAILGLGITMAIPGAVVAQNADDQTPDQDAQASSAPSSVNPGGPMQPGPNGAGSNDASAADPSYNTPAPEETRGVARISLIHGDVSTERGDSKEWSAAALNAPVVAGDRVSTGDKARTELQLDYANMLRLAERTQANITTLTHSQIVVQLGHGMANYSVFQNSDAEAEIDTPNVAIHTERREASFRILVTADDHTEVFVRRGEVEVTTPQGGTRVAQGQSITVQGTGDQEQYKIGANPPRDDWDQWNSDRDNMIRNAASRKRTNDYYVGAEDLDSYGTWTEIPDYGPVWRPTVSVGWAPYRAGRWVYEPYWGWTWVSYDPWGWAPYHYGRWMMYDGWWGWWPGPVYGYPYYRPIWAPAYVSFFGWGGGFGFGFGFGWGWGSIGWLPLGPCDHFHPWWGAWGGRFGTGRFETFNRGGFAALHGGTRFSNVNLAMHDAHFRGATTVSGKEFGSGHMSARPATHAEIQNAHISTGKLGVTPTRASYSASGRAAAPSTTRNVAEHQHFFSGRSNTASSASRSAGSGREAARPASSGSNARSSARSSNNSNGGFRQFNRGSENSSERSSEARGNTNAGPAARTGNASSNVGNNGGWQKFSPMPPRPSSESGRAGGPAGSSRGAVLGGRGYGSGGYGGSRPPLNMRQPIVTPRSYGRGPGGGVYGGGRSAPSGGSSHSSGGSHSGGGSHGGGGGSHGGGGHR